MYLIFVLLLFDNTVLYFLGDDVWERCESHRCKFEILLHQACNKIVRGTFLEFNSEMLAVNLDWIV